MRDYITTALDLLGLLALAIGAAAAAYLLIGWACVAIGGLVVLAGARVIEWVATPSAAPNWWRRLCGAE